MSNFQFIGRHTLWGTLVLVVVTAAIIGGCSNEDPVAPAIEPPADVNEYFTTLPSWNAFSPPREDNDIPTGDPETVETLIDEQPYVCTSTPYSMTRTPEKIVTFNPDVEVLWIGALLQGKGYLGGVGSLAELPVRERAPVTVSIDLLNDDNTRTIGSPTLASVQQAIGELVESADAAGHQAGSNIFFTKEEAYTLDQAALSMGLSASYMGASIKSSLSASISNETRTVTAYFIQRMFTVSMVLPDSPDAMFSDEFTEERLQAEISRGRIGPDNVPVYVSSVAYGRILIFSFTSTASAADINATLNIMYNQGDFGGGVDMESKFQSILENAEISVVTVGGDADDALRLIRANDLGAYFESDAPLTTAKPISYTIRNLGDNTIARVAETTDYNLEECVPGEVMPVGAKYRVNIGQIKLIADTDGSFNPDAWSPPPRNDHKDAEVYYTFWREDQYGTEKFIDYPSKILDPFAARLSENEVFQIVNPGGNPPAAFEVDLYFDGRAQFTVRGDVYDSDLYDYWPSSDDLLAHYELNYTTSIPVGKLQYTRSKPGTGCRVQLLFTVTKIGDLYD